MGEILAGYSKTLLLVASTIRVALASQSIVTIFDLEAAILLHPMFKNKDGFEDACIGKLHYHPLVRRYFGLDSLGEIPASFPTISGSELLRHLFSADVLQQLGGGSRLSNTRVRSVTAGLLKIAEKYQLDDVRHLGALSPAAC